MAHRLDKSIFSGKTGEIVVDNIVYSDLKPSNKPTVSLNLDRTYIVGEAIPYDFNFNDRDGCGIENVQWENNLPTFSTSGWQTIRLRVQDDCGVWSAWVSSDIYIIASGDGTVSNPYLISNSYELDSIRGYQIPGWDVNKHYKVINDIDLSSIYDWTGARGFSGSIDGGGHTISGLRMSASNDGMV